MDRLAVVVINRSYFLECTTSSPKSGDMVIKMPIHAGFCLFSSGFDGGICSPISFCHARLYHCVAGIGASGTAQKSAWGQCTVESMGMQDRLRAFLAFTATITMSGIRRVCLVSAGFRYQNWRCDEINIIYSMESTNAAGSSSAAATTQSSSSPVSTTGDNGNSIDRGSSP